MLKVGAIILNHKDNNKIALLYRGKQNDWSFPKGHVDPGENAIQTMVREIREETGLTVRIIKELPDMEYHNNIEGSISIKMFLVESEDDSKLKIEFKNDKIQWVQLNKVNKKLSYDNLKDYYNSILQIIKNAINHE